MKRHRLGLLVLVAACGSGDVIQGETDAVHVSVAAKVCGRVDSMYVREGDMVRHGQVVATLDGPEIRARAVQAQAARDAAQAQWDKARNGSREEDIRAARSNYQRAVAAATIAETTFARLDRLQGEGVVATQRRDEAEASFRTARDGAEAARAQYEVALAGLRVEDRAAATAELRRADGAVREVTSYVDENTLRSPLDGQVMVEVVEQGGIGLSGLPLLTIVDLSDQWVTVNLREDRLAGLRVGHKVRATIPAVDAEPRLFTVYYISPLGSFATWRATREAGGVHVPTFEVRAPPTQPIDGLRPGMTPPNEWPGPRR